jgi:drug/metabolite transporter (DMT)-like permease
VNGNRRAIRFVLAFVLLWAGLEATAGLLTLHYSSYQVVWARYAVHLTLMLAIWGWRDPASLWRTERPIFQFCRSILMVGMPAAWIIGTKLGVSTPAMLSVFWLSPVILLLMAWGVLGEFAPTVVWITTALAFAGTSLLLWPNFKMPPYLLLFPFVMGLCFSAYVAMTRSLRTENRPANLFYTAAGVFVVLTPLMPHVWITPSMPDMLVFIGIGTIGFLALLAIDVGVAVAPVSISAPITYLQLIFTTIIAAQLTDKRPTHAATIGMLLIGASVLYVWARAPYIEVLEAK